MFLVGGGKIALVRAFMVVTYYTKLFRTRADRRNGTLMSFLVLVTETISSVSMVYFKSMLEHAET